MSFDWADIVTLHLSQPWWVWLVRCVAAWFGLKWLIGAVRAYRERSIATANGFWRCGVRVDFRAGTIALPRGDVFLVQRVRGLRWEDHVRSGSYHAMVNVDDLTKPVHPVAFSTRTGPEAFVSRLRTAIELAGGPHFSIAANEQVEIVERDLSDPITAAVATRVRALGRRASYSRWGERKRTPREYPMNHGARAAERQRRSKSCRSRGRMALCATPTNNM